MSETREETKNNEGKESTYLRQLDFFDPDQHDRCEVHVIGAGGIGSFTTVALAKLGLSKITVWDGDNVEVHNVPNQLHLVKAVGISKVKALASLARQLTGITIKPKEKMWEPTDPLSGIVITAVDTMKVRQQVWEAVKPNPKIELLIDGRMGGQEFRILTIRPIQDIFQHQWYETNLFEDKDSAKLPCTGRAIIDVGFAIAAVIARQVRGFLKDGKFVYDLAVSMADLSIMKLRVGKGKEGK
jgi:hypothetical protein